MCSIMWAPAPGAKTCTVTAIHLLELTASIQIMEQRWRGRFPVTTLLQHTSLVRVNELLLQLLPLACTHLLCFEEIMRVLL